MQEFNSFNSDDNNSMDLQENDAQLIKNIFSNIFQARIRETLSKLEDSIADPTKIQNSLEVFSTLNNYGLKIEVMVAQFLANPNIPVTLARMEILAEHAAIFDLINKKTELTNNEYNNLIKLLNKYHLRFNALEEYIDLSQKRILNKLSPIVGHDYVFQLNADGCCVGFSAEKLRRSLRDEFLEHIDLLVNISLCPQNLLNLQNPETQKLHNIKVDTSAYDLAARIAILQTPESYMSSLHQTSFQDTIPFIDFEVEPQLDLKFSYVFNREELHFVFEKFGDILLTSEKVSLLSMDHSTTLDAIRQSQLSSNHNKIIHSDPSARGDVTVSKYDGLIDSIFKTFRGSSDPSSRIPLSLRFYSKAGSNAVKSIDKIDLFLNLLFMSGENDLIHQLFINGGFDNLASFSKEYPDSIISCLKTRINNLESDTGESVLFTVISNNDADLLKACLEIGADPNKKNGSGYSPLGFAINNNYTQMVEILLSSPNIVIRSNEVSNSGIVTRSNEINALFNAVNKNYGKILVKLLDHDLKHPFLSLDDKVALAEFASENHSTPAAHHIFCYFNACNTEHQSRIIEYMWQTLWIKQRKANLFPDPVKNIKLLNEALATRSLNSINVLLSSKDNFGNTPLHLSVEANDIAMTLALINIIKNGDSINAKNNEGNTPLMIAAARGNVQLVELLIYNGANPNKLNNHNKTAWMLADENNHAQISQFLYNYKPSYNYTENTQTINNNNFNHNNNNRNSMSLLMEKVGFRKGRDTDDTTTQFEQPVDLNLSIKGP